MPECLHRRPLLQGLTYNPKVKWCFLKSDFNQLYPFAGAIAGKVVELRGEADIGAPPRLDFVSDDLLAAGRDVKAECSFWPNEQQGFGGQRPHETARSELTAGNSSPPSRPSAVRLR